MNIKAVIGAQFGDEGKGLVTDYLSTLRTLVVRFNGGAQAGHTVVTPNGQRHEFHHFGAGTFRGAGTVLSRFFLVNPILFGSEYEELRPWSPIAVIDPRCNVTTPFDMMLNRAVEDKRGTDRHGSCGLGINETVTRSEQDYFRLTMNHVKEKRLRDIWQRIAHEYVPVRARELDVEPPSLKLDAYQRFYDACEFLVKRSSIWYDFSAIHINQQVVFEGAQGLRLDEERGQFPYVTRSRTGLDNVCTLLADAGRDREGLDVYYVTRSYATRHGVGPLTDEVDGHPFRWRGPETNVTNQYQGKLRYGFLRCDELKEAVMSAMDAGAPLHHVHSHMAITCLDQCMAKDDPRLIVSTVDDVVLPVALTSYGPTRDHVKQLMPVS